MKRRSFFTICVVVALLSGFANVSLAHAALIWQIQTVDSVGAGDVGQFTSLTLDSNGYPVISYWDVLNGDLKLAHCGDASCSSGNSLVTVDSAGKVGWYNSLALDSNGNPVISYSDATNGDLKLAHCGDANCSSGNSLVTVDSAGDVGYYTSLALDSLGNPMISYYDGTNFDLKLVHCGDANCTSGNSIVTVDSTVFGGSDSSLALDSNGYPVISYYDFGNYDVKLAHCGDANCSSGNSLVTVDSAGMVGQHTSLALDSNGNPVISYQEFIYGFGKLAHCGNANCTSGNSIVYASGSFPSLALDSAGNPVISSEDTSFTYLRLVHCTNANCSGNSNTATVDADGSVGWYTSLALDSAGNPVISYYDLNNKDLKLAHCGDANCSRANNTVTVDNGGVDRVGEYNSLALDSLSNPVISYYNSSTRDLKLAHCGNADCSSGNSPVTVDSAGDVGSFTSLALDSMGNPVISYSDATNRDLRLAHCGSADCSSGNSIVSLDSAGNVGWYTSLALDSAGNPVISYLDIGNADLKLVHCGNANCTSGNSIVTVDSSGSVGWYTSLVLDSAGNPVISYYDNIIGDLKLAHCGDANCSSGNSLVTVGSAGNTGMFNSLALDSVGNPVISYYDSTNGVLKLAHCGDANCTNANSILSVDSAGFSGKISLALDSMGNPVISYWSNTYRDLKLAHCGNADCSNTNSIVTVDSVEWIGDFPSLILDSRGNPVISYHELSNGDLKLARLVNTDTTPPTASSNGPYSVNEGASVTVNASGSDPEGGILSYAWNLDNDGTFETAGQSVTFSAATLDGPSTSTINVQVTDEGGLTATDQANVEVLNVAPTATLTSTPVTLVQGQSATLAFNNPFDPGAADTAAGFRYSYDCTNDGTFELTSASDASYTCAYPNAGTFNALGRIADKDGGFTDYTVPVKVLTPREGTEGLIDQVKELIPGTLNVGQGNALISKLEAAIQQLDQGKVAAALNQLEAFVNEVNADISSGKLTLAEGQPLLDAANAIIASLGG